MTIIASFTAIGGRIRVSRHEPSLRELEFARNQLDVDEAFGDACRAVGASPLRIWRDNRRTSRQRQRRMVAKMLKHQGFNHSEIARAMKRTRSAVMWMLRNGRTKTWASAS